MLENNPEINKLRSEFKFPEGSLIEYDIHAPKDKWVITSVNHKPVDRDFEKWPLISGEF